MEAIYVISTKEKSNNNEYKIGKHTGTQSKLLSRYKTPLINPVIYFYLHCENSLNVENEIKKLLKDKRIKNEDGAYTEWVKLNLQQIVNNIYEILNKNITNVNYLNNLNDNISEYKKIETDEIDYSLLTKIFNKHINNDLIYFWKNVFNNLKIKYKELYGIYQFELLSEPKTLVKIIDTDNVNILKKLKLQLSINIEINLLELKNTKFLILGNKFIKTDVELIHFKKLLPSIGIVYEIDIFIDDEEELIPCFAMLADRYLKESGCAIYYEEYGHIMYITNLNDKNYDHKDYENDPEELERIEKLAIKNSSLLL